MAVRLYLSASERGNRCDGHALRAAGRRSGPALGSGAPTQDFRRALGFRFRADDLHGADELTNLDRVSGCFC